VAGTRMAGFSVRPAQAGGNMSLPQHISPASFPILFLPARRSPIQGACSQVPENVAARAITNVDAGAGGEGRENDYTMLFQVKAVWEWEESQ